jgi:hypothetical protein
MQNTFKPSALAVVLVSAIALAGCSTSSAGPSAALQPAVEVPPPDLKAEAMAERREKERKQEEIARDVRNLGVDDYFAASPSVHTFGQKNRRELEIEKIHRLAKMCIAANNVSPPCLDIISTNARTGKLFILQETDDLADAVSTQRA